MYQDEVNVINIQSNQLSNLAGQITILCSSMQSLAAGELVDKDSLKAYIASIDILMTSVQSQSILLQQALDKLAKELAG